MRRALSLVIEMAGTGPAMTWWVRQRERHQDVGDFPPFRNRRKGLQSRSTMERAVTKSPKGDTSMTARTKPPFRADHVGSILRSAPLKEAREKAAKGEITAVQLKAVEDQEIPAIIAKQEALGLGLVTDGEYRRSWWHFDFFGMLDGSRSTSSTTAFSSKAPRPSRRASASWGRSGFPGTRCWNTSSS
jgi:hypothetical protein